MSEIKTSDVAFFFGAGASASFGIPTMKQFVTLFEKELQHSFRSEKRRLYDEIKSSLESKLQNAPDLEAIFTVIDGIAHYELERIGPFSLYWTEKFRGDKPQKKDVRLARMLNEQFRLFVRVKCRIPRYSFTHIGEVYQDFFNRFALELVADGVGHHDGYHYQNRWSIFTTNYDTCLECYWRQIAKVGIDTGFETDEARAARILRNSKLLSLTEVIRLFKLHGSINWMVEKETGDVIEEEMTGGSSHLGRKFAGRMMIYPIAEKELYKEPSRIPAALAAG
jgi:hypothetical protein